MKCSFEIVKFNVILDMHHLVFYRLVYGSPGYGIHWVDIAVRWHCSPAGQNIFLEKKHNPPPLPTLLEVKWSGPKCTYLRQTRMQLQNI
jgi:hypothetical protein